MDRIKDMLHVALPYLSYVINMFNRMLSLLSSFIGIEIPEVIETETEESTTE